MTLVVVVYPEIEKNDYQWIQDYRERYDELYFKEIGPHFTLVFPVFNYSDEKVVINHIESCLRKSKSFEFTLDHAVINDDAFNDYWHTFLVPGEGYEEIIKLHGILYTGPLAKELRTDLQFIPHVGIGNSKNKEIITEQVNMLNSDGINIHGSIKRIDICRYDDKVITIKTITLR